MNRNTPFVGRVSELAALEESLAGAILGRGSAVVLAGEPGIGKTRLAGELCDRAERRGARVLWARCASDAGAPAYWPFAQLLAPLYDSDDVNELTRRFGPGARDAIGLVTHQSNPAPPDHAADTRQSISPPPASEQQRFRLFDAVSAMLLEAASDRPLVLVFDDIHAADPGCNCSSSSRAPFARLACSSSPPCAPPRRGARTSLPFSSAASPARPSRSRWMDGRATRSAPF